MEGILRKVGRCFLPASSRFGVLAEVEVAARPHLYCFLHGTTIALEVNSYLHLLASGFRGIFSWELNRHQLAVLVPALPQEVFFSRLRLRVRTHFYFSIFQFEYH